MELAIALTVLAVGFAGSAGAAITLGVKFGSVKGDLTVSKADLLAAQTAVDLAAKAVSDSEAADQERIRRQDLVISELKGKLGGLRDDLQNHPDPFVRGNVAIDSIAGLLSEMQATQDRASGGDQGPGSVSPQD